MSNRDPDARFERPEQVIPWAIEQWVWAHVHTTMPGIVESYDARTKRAVIQPAIRTRLRPTEDDPNPGLMDKPPIVNVPLRQPATGGHMVHHEVGRGDVVVLHFTERGIGQFKERWGRLADPDRGHYYDMRDAMAVLWGVETIEPVSDQGMVMQSADGDTYIHVVDGTITMKVGRSTVTITDGNVRVNSPRIDLN